MTTKHPISSRGYVTESNLHSGCSNNEGSLDFKLNVGSLAEDEVQQAVEKAFSPEFVFRSPPREGGKELTDILVLFGDVALVTECKAQALSAGGHKPAKALSWAKKQLTKAAKQVRGGIRAIREGKVQHVENRRRGRIAFRHEDFPWLYGVIVLHHESAPYWPRELVPAIQKVPVPVHVLSFRDFHNLAHLLDTPYDLINYLESRTDVLIPHRNPKVHEEQIAFAHYVECLEGILASRAKAHGDQHTPDDFTTYADGVRRIVTGTHPHLGCGRVIDHMLDKIHNVDLSLRVVDTSGKLLPPSEKSAYAEIATKLGSISRVSRIALGRLYLATAERAAKSRRVHYRLTYSPKRSECILFHASPLPFSQREKRAQTLLDLTEMAKAHRQAKCAIGIATEAGHRAGRSYDMVLLKGPPIPDVRVQELTRRIFGDTATPLADEAGL